MRKSTIFVLIIAGNLMLLVTITLLNRQTTSHTRGEIRKLVAELSLTDLCMFTEAPYTRHPAMADLHAPFQDHPSAFDHFPAGSILPVPRTLHEYLDRTPAQHP